MRKPKVQIYGFVLGITLLVTVGLIHSWANLTYWYSPSYWVSLSSNGFTNKSEVSSFQPVLDSYSPSVLWAFETELEEKLYSYSGLFHNTPAIRDINSDQKVEIIFGSGNGKVYAVDINGSQVWVCNLTNPIPTSPVVGDIDNDSKLEVIVGSLDNNLYVLDAMNGIPKWSYQIGDLDMSSLVLADLDNDSILELIVSHRLSVAALKAKDSSFKIFWTYSPPGTVLFSTPAVGDFNLDKTPDICIGCTNSRIYALNGKDGSLLWNYTTNGAVYSAPILGDIDCDQKLEVIVGSNDYSIYALNAEDCSPLWSYSTEGSIRGSFALGDIDYDKKQEVIFGNNDRKVFALNAEDGSPLWDYETEAQVQSSPSVADIDNDMQLEVIIIDEGFNVYALKNIIGVKTPQNLWTYQIPKPNTKGYMDSIGRSSPVLADLDNNSRLELIVGFTECREPEDEPLLEIPTVFALNLEGAGYRIYWEGMRGNSQFLRTLNLQDLDPDKDFISTYSENVKGTNPLDNDTDNDGILDGWEVTFSLNPFLNDTFVDSDNDELTNLQESQYNTNPRIEDTDGDNLDDYSEVSSGTNPRENDAGRDPDGDGLSNLEEILYLETDPYDNDTDDDGLSDGDEVNKHGTSPKDNDTDNDSLPDGWEVNYGLYPLIYDRSEDPDNDDLLNYEEYFHKTFPNDNDSDGDGLTDYFEVKEYIGLNATDPDTDADGMFDGWEYHYQFNPLNPTDAALDSDGDGITNLDEFKLFLNSSWPLDPTKKDTDADGLSDGFEVGINLNPVKSDTDNDTVLDGREIDLGLNATDPDTDGDGDFDGFELSQWLLDPKNPWLNTNTRSLVIFGTPTVLIFISIVGAIIKFWYFPKRTSINQQLSQWWNRNIWGVRHKEEEIRSYIDKAKDIKEIFEEENK
ncbi:MAG: PQQ-binding-like beta-propeller repeat protein [Promethearchaeota archaeon]